MQKIKFFIYCAFIAAIFLAPAIGINSANATTISDLQASISKKSADIDSIQKEIDVYEEKLRKTGKEAQTLSDALKILDISRKKLEADISVTQDKIDYTNLLISDLSLGIDDKISRISAELSGISKSIRDLNESESVSFVENILSDGGVTKYWEESDNLSKIQEHLKNKITELKKLKDNLQGQKTNKEKIKADLVVLRAKLSDQKKIVEQNKKEKNNLLLLTKNQESNYKKILEQKIALKNAFERELSDFESQLKIAIDPSSIPKSASGVLFYPLNKIIITQKFGITAFSLTTNAYANNSHNGVDFAASVGTPIKAAKSGIVKGSGNTDTVCPGASFGNWILLEHSNGLSTLYAHLSLIKVVAGQRVETGEVIGYSGNTGFSTGPHLHFTVYATQGVKIMSRKSTVCRGTYTMPIADPKAYLDPLLYL